MWSKDFAKVLHGAGKVAEQLVRVAEPQVSNRASRLANHAYEVARVIPQAVTQPSASVPVSAPEKSKTPFEEDAFKEEPFVPAVQFLQSDPHLPAEPVDKAPEAVKEAPEPVKEVPEPAESVDPSASSSAKVDELLQEVQKEQKKMSSQQPPASFEPSLHHWEEKRVPSSPFSRILGFGSLAARLAMGTATEIVRSGGRGGAYNALTSDANAEKLVETLCTMRGAALKLGQMLSLQDEAMMPSRLSDALDRVRQNAHVMPKSQLHAQLSAELGADWRDRFLEFDDVPIAAASIGQVHRGTLHTGERVAIKIQYPGVAESIESDLVNLKRLVTYTNILPKGLYIDEIIRVAKDELTLECDYKLEAKNQDRFRKLIQEYDMNEGYLVPKVYHDFTTSRILTTELISGVAVDKVVNLSQEVRDSVARRLLVLTIHELFDWKFMQTDPNWSNFMYNSSTDQIGLVDFGAARDYDPEFVDEYFKLVWAAANQDEAKLHEYSVKMRFLTGDESPAMTRAHIAAGMVVGEPFRSAEPFDFAKSNLTKRLAHYTETFMHGRLTPPPQEVYSLHRKLAGAFLMCIKLRAVVSCRDVLEQVANRYQE